MRRTLAATCLLLTSLLSACSEASCEDQLAEAREKFENLNFNDVEAMNELTERLQKLSAECG